PGNGVPDAGALRMGRGPQPPDRGLDRARGRGPGRADRSAPGARRGASGAGPRDLAAAAGRRRSRRRQVAPGDDLAQAFLPFAQFGREGVAEIVVLEYRADLDLA